MSQTVPRMFAPLPASYVPELRRQTWARLFGLGIRATRKEAGLTIEEAAKLSGMQISEWSAIEEGHVPQEISRLRAIASTLGISFEKVMNWVFLCREAWQL